ncbi:MAG: FAD-binding oxidoreductase [archaeon]|nr:MAG: FAD-binding oxidoreductase [archaeon]
MKELTSKEDLEALSRDAGIITFHPQRAFEAETEVDVISSLKLADDSGLSLTPRGGGTSIPSQSVGRGIVLVQKMQGFALVEGVASCGPALVKGKLNEALGDLGLWMPVDPSSYSSCTVGGMAANNSAGIRTPKYGTTIDHVEWLRVILPGGDAMRLEPGSLEEAANGSDPRVRKVCELILQNHKEILAERPRVSKNSSGFRLERAIEGDRLHLEKLFVGSEGTLGVFTEVGFATRRKPGWRVLFVVETTLEGLGDAVSAFRSTSPTAIELLDRSVFRRMGKEEMLSKYAKSDSNYLLFTEYDGEGSPDAKIEEVAGSKVSGYEPLVITDPAAISEAWEVRNETLKLGLQVRSGGKVLVPGVEDLVVPGERLPDLVRLLQTEFDRRGLEYISYGHAGDANLHARPLLDPTDSSGRRTLDNLMDECFEAVWRMGGSMTGEHGDGMLRAPYVGRQYPKTYWIMKEIKSLFDPKGVLNPGVKLV